jgi:adenylate cyclase
MSVAGVIEPALQAAETARSAQRPTSDLTAYDLYLRAYAVVRSSGRILDALRLVEQAIERDPNYAPALAYAAVCHRRLVIDGQSEDPDTAIRQGADLARRALQVAGDNARKGVPTVRRKPRRRRTATGMRADRSRPPEKVEPIPVSDLPRQP